MPGLLHVWDFTRDGRAKKGKDPGFEERAADQLEFLARTMHKFNADMAAYLRQELGCKQLINANNWRTVDLVTTQDAEYWAGTANDVIARNIYTGGMHQGVNNGWQILPGHFYSDLSLIQEPLHLPTNVKQPRGPPVHADGGPVVSAQPVPVRGGADGRSATVSDRTRRGLLVLNWVAEWEQSPQHQVDLLDADADRAVPRRCVDLPPRAAEGR